MATKSDVIWKGSDQRARALALALANNPQASMVTLAKMAGIGRTTLHRLAPTRETLIAAIENYSAKCTVESVEKIDMEGSSTKDALQQIARFYLEQREFFAFWLTRLWTIWSLVGDEDPRGVLIDKLLVLIQRAKLRGELRIDVSDHWLLNTFHSIVIGAVEGQSRGTLETKDAHETVVKLFLSGAGAPDASYGEFSQAG